MPFYIQGKAQYNNEKPLKHIMAEDELKDECFVVKGNWRWEAILSSPSPSLLIPGRTSWTVYESHHYGTWNQRRTYKKRKLRLCIPFFSSSSQPFASPGREEEKYYNIHIFYKVLILFNHKSSFVTHFILF